MGKLKKSNIPSRTGKCTPYLSEGKKHIFQPSHWWQETHSRDNRQSEQYFL